jgi:hypothetical protein
MSIHHNRCNWNDEFQRRTVFVSDDESVGYTDFVPNSAFVKVPAREKAGKRKRTAVYWTVATLAIVTAAASVFVIVSLP